MSSVTRDGWTWLCRACGVVDGEMLPLLPPFFVIPAFARELDIRMHSILPFTDRDYVYSSGRRYYFYYLGFMHKPIAISNQLLLIVTGEWVYRPGKATEGNINVAKRKRGIK